MKRLVVYPKDVEMITGRKGNYCREVIRIIKNQNNKTKSQLVTLTELCKYLGLDESKIDLK